MLCRALSLGRLLVLFAVFSCAGCSAAPSPAVIWLGPAGVPSGAPRQAGGRLSLAHLQFKGSHNSYHRAPRISLSRQWHYTNAPLDVQLESQGVRQLELDVRYERGELIVSHLPVIDGRTSCRTLRRCLSHIKRWTRRQPWHLPIFVFIEAKEALVPSGLDGRIDAIEAAIAQTFPRSSLLIPDDVTYPGLSLRDSVLEHGWPLVSEVRGRLAFVLFGRAKHREAYTRSSQRLRPHLMFVAGEPHRPEVAFLMIDDPVRHGESIRRAVRAGFLVRTRADAALVRIPARRDAALASGAHFVTTDFADPRHHWLDIGDGAHVRCNPISAPRACARGQLAELERHLWLARAGPAVVGP